MRIALLHPTYWPEIRRGSERLLHDLAAELARRGHEPTVQTSHPGRTTVDRENGFAVVRSRRLRQPPTLGLNEDFLGNVPPVIWRVLRGGYDVVHAFHLAYAWAAVRAHGLGGPPVVFSFHGMPTRRELVARRYRLEMMESVVGGAAASAVLSESAAEPFRRYLRHEPEVLPGGVRAADFAIGEPRASQPTIVCAASIGDYRKRGDLILRAFAELRNRRPDARLRIVRTPDPLLSPHGLALPDGAQWVEADATPDLAREYARAWVSVLASVDEPFGLVLVESLAAGTPVVATESGACPEILTEPAHGSLFAPDDRGALVDALDAALAAPPSPEVADACRVRAVEFDWGRVGDRYEAVYERVARAKAVA